MNKEILVIGIGNSLKCDDGLGPYLSAELARDQELSERCAFLDYNSYGIDLLELLIGYKRILILDSMDSQGQFLPGTSFYVHISQYRHDPTLPISSTHGISLLELTALASSLQIELTDDIYIYAVEVFDALNFSESLSEKMQQLLPALLKDIREKIVHF